MIEQQQVQCLWVNQKEETGGAREKIKGKIVLKVLENILKKAT